MVDLCFHDVNVTGEEKVIAEIGRLVDAEWLWATKEAFERGDVIVNKLNVQFVYETKGVRLAEVARIALQFPTVHILHFYEEPNAPVRGFVIYEGGRLIKRREVKGEPFVVGSWLSFLCDDDDE